jgi:glycosyltransferase
MKVSIITAVYNNHSMVAKAVESVLAQKNIEIEYIVIDGQSTDGTLEIIESYRDKIDILVSGRDGGIYQALNKGLSLATGDYVGFLHSDDFFANDHVLEKLFKNITGEEAAVYGDLDYVLKNNVHKVVRHWKSMRFTPKLLKMGWMPPHPALYVRRDIFNSLAGFDPQYKIAADYHFILRLFREQKHVFSYVPGVVVKMRTGGASNNSIGNIFKKFNEQRRILNSLGMGGGGVVLRKMLNKLHQFV